MISRQVVRMAHVLALATVWFVPAARADQFLSFSLIPASGDISGPAGSTIGWGYSITNSSGADWIETTALNAGSFLNLDPGVVPNPNVLFDFPILAPGATITATYGPGVFGLYEITWDPSAPIGFVNSGDFVLSAELWSADPAVAGAMDLGPEPDLSAPYTATVAGVPEPSSLLLLAGACALMLLIRGLHSQGRVS